MSEHKLVASSQCGTELKNWYELCELGQRLGAAQVWEQSTAQVTHLFPAPFYQLLYCGPSRSPGTPYKACLHTILQSRIEIADS